MSRVFQHYTGEIDCLQGLTVQGLSCLYHHTSERNDAILFWMETSGKEFFRCFIDGSYCGVDAFGSNLSDQDLEVDTEYRNFDACVRGLSIDSASVTSGPLPVIKLQIHFNNGSSLLFACNREKECLLRFDAVKPQI